MPESHEPEYSRLQIQLADSARGYQTTAPQINADTIQNLVVSMSASNDQSSFLNFASVVREADPIELGVHRAPVENGSPLSPYVFRDFDSELDAILNAASAGGGFVVLVGDSTSGKSRSAYQALLRQVPEFAIYSPDTNEHLYSSTMAIAASTRRIVLWLDDIERFLSGGALSVPIIRLLKSRGVIIIGTLRSQFYSRFIHHSSQDEDDGGHNHSFGVGERVLLQADLVILSRKWSEAEVERARTSTDPRIMDAIAHHREYGIAEYLAAGPSLYHEWKLSAGVGSNPRGAALVSSAVDFMRAGLTDALPVKLIEHAHEWYLQAEGGDLLRPEGLEEALAWAFRRRHGVTSLLLPVMNDHAKAFDYLADVSPRNDLERDETLPDVIWELAERYALDAPRALDGLAKGAVAFGKLDLAERCWEAMAEGGDYSSLPRYCRHLERSGRLMNAESWLRRAAESGDVECRTSLGIFLQKHSRLTEAEDQLRVAAEAGNDHAAYHLGIVLASQGRLAEAESWYRRMHNLHSGNHYVGLAYVMLESGRVDDAEKWLQKEIAAGNSEARRALGYLRQRSRNYEGAVPVLEALFNEGRQDVLLDLAYCREKLGDDDICERLYRLATELNLPECYSALSTFLSNQNREDEALEVLNLGAEKGDVDCVLQISRSLSDEDQSERALVLLQSVSDKGDARPVREIGLIYKGLGREDEAAENFVRAAEMGDPFSAHRAGRAAADGGDLTTAERFLRIAASTENVEALCDLGLISDQLGRPGAHKFYERSLDLGHGHAGCRWVASPRAESMAVDEQIDILVRVFKTGHGHVAKQISDLYARAGNGAKAAQWLKNSRRSGKSRGQSRSRRRRQKRR